MCASRRALPGKEPAPGRRPAGGRRPPEHSQDNQGGISQSLSLTAGDWYKLSFYLSGNPDGNPQTKSVTVSVGNLDEIFSYTLNGATRSDMQYIVETAYFKADPTNTLSFTSNDVRSSYGPAIGGVSVTAVPEAATWAMLVLGFVGLGCADFRRRKAAISMT